MHYPMFVRDKNETNEEVIARWDIFDTLPENIQEKVSSDDTANEIKSLADGFNLAPMQIMAVSRAIRRYYFGEISLEGILVSISQETGLDARTCEGIYKAIKEKIITSTVREPAKMIQITISEALKKYSEIGEQAITSEKLELKSFPYPVRPSINNWISDYTFTVGFNNKNPMMRGNYLFHNKNTERLTEEERNRLSQILKSLDENTPISIDESSKAVLFLKMEKPQERQGYIPRQKNNPPASDDDSILKDRLSAWRRSGGMEHGAWNMEQKNNSKDQDDFHNENASSLQKNNLQNDTVPSRMIFSSPQRLPIEKNIPKVDNNAVFQKPSPVSNPTPKEPAKTYFNEPVDLSNMQIKSANSNNPTVRNVVNLREE